MVPANAGFRNGCVSESSVNKSYGRAEVSGRTGIRTLEGLSPLTVFKTVAFVRSATLPDGAYPPICI